MYGVDNIIEQCLVPVGSHGTCNYILGHLWHLSDNVDEYYFEV